MSAYLSSSDTLSALASYWLASHEQHTYSYPISDLRRALYHGTPGMTWGDASVTADKLSDGRSLGLVVYELLLAENQASLAARYPDAEDYRKAEGYAYKFDRAVERSVQRNKTGWIVSLLNGYEYQSCEHDSWTRSVGYQLCLQIRKFLCDDLQRLQDPDEQHCYWANYDRSVWAAPKPSVPA